MSLAFACCLAVAALETGGLQRAIDLCPAGGCVEITAGTHRTGALWLKSDMTLRLAKGAVLQGSDDPADYPVWDWWFEGRRPEPCYASLLNVPVGGVSNLVICGEGIVDGAGERLLPAEEHERRGKRGRILGVSNSRHVRVEGVTFRESPCWALHFIYCSDVTLSNVTVRTKDDGCGRIYRGIHNGDGVDIDSCRGVRIIGSRIFSQDDCIAVKSGRDAYGRELGRPSEDIEIRDSFFGSGLGVAIGSEMSGGVRHVRVSDCVFSNTFSLASIKAVRGRGGVVEDIVFERCRFANRSRELEDMVWFRGGIYLDLFYSIGNPDEDTSAPVGDGTPRFRNIVFRDIEAETVVSSAIYAVGLPEAPIEDLVFENVRAAGRWGMKRKNIGGLVLRNCTVSAQEGETYR